MKFSKYLLQSFFLCVALFAIRIDGMQRQKSWRGRAVLMTQNPRTQEWSVLLAHNVKGPDVWSDFSLESRGGERANVVASRAIREQTGGQYTVDLTTARHYYKQSPAGDWFHFVSVPYIAGSDLYSRGRNAQKDDFMWVPASAIIDRKPIVHPRRGPIMISQGVYNFLHQNLSAAINFLTQGVAAPVVQPPVQPQVVIPAAGTPAAVGAPWGPNKRNHIYFYHNNKPYYEFTNFYYARFNLRGQDWPTSEHFFQAQKYPNNSALQARIRNAATPREAFNITREAVNDQYKDPKWDTNKFQIMLEAVRSKFNQHPALKNMLLKTGDSVLVEDAGANDTVWGAGADYRGTNHLGRILMHVRDELQGKISPGTPYTP